MKTFQIQLPDSVDVDSNELKKFMAAKLYEAARLSLIQAAEMAGCSIEDFTSLLFTYNVSVFNYPASDLESDVRNAEKSIR